MKIPEIKKNVKSFLLNEEGKISKQSILKVGAILAAVSTAVSMNSSPVDAASASVECCGSCHASAEWYEFHQSSCHVNVNIPSRHIDDIQTDYDGDTGVGEGSHVHAHSVHCNGSDSAVSEGWFGKW